jgi:hypothetical protein
MKSIKKIICGVLAIACIVSIAVAGFSINLNKSKDSTELNVVDVKAQARLRGLGTCYKLKSSSKKGVKFTKCAAGTTATKADDCSKGYDLDGEPDDSSAYICLL